MKQIITLSMIMLLYIACTKELYNGPFYIMPPPPAINDTLAGRASTLRYLFSGTVEVEPQDSLLIFTAIVEAAPDSAAYRVTLNPIAWIIYNAVFYDQRTNTQVIDKVKIRFLILFWDRTLQQITRQIIFDYPLRSKFFYN